MRGGHKGPHVPRVAQIFDAALVFPGFDLRRTHAAQALLRRPQHLKTGFRMTGFEQACGSGVFRQTFGFQEAAYQQKDRRPGGGQRGKGHFGEAIDVHAVPRAVSTRASGSRMPASRNVRMSS